MDGGGGNSFGGGNAERNMNQEQAPTGAFAGGFEQLPQVPNIESPLAAGNETEQAVSSGENQPAFAQPQSVAQPQPVQSGQTQSATQAQPQPTDKLPVTAGHANRIEKAWIDRGEKIFQETKDDPHAQKDRIDDLKEEYQTARYGTGGGAA